MATRKIVRIDEENCDGCGLCVPACHEGAIEIVDEKARLVEDKLCDGIGDCLGECPQGAIEIVEREAEEFDEEAVKRRLEELKGKQSKTAAEPAQAAQKETGGGCPGSRPMQMGGGCPGSQAKTLKNDEIAAADESQQNESEQSNDAESTSEPAVSQLRQWPVQMHLLSPQAPYFENCDLLIAADCVPFAYPEFHNQLLKDKSVAIGCPKLDDGNSYVEKLAQILSVNDINSITVAIMEVPCCSGLMAIVNKAIQLAEVDIPVEQVVIGVQGERK